MHSSAQSFLCIVFTLLQSVWCPEYVFSLNDVNTENIQLPLDADHAVQMLHERRDF